MRTINVTEFKKNLSYYIELCKKEDIQVAKNGVVVAVLTNPDKQYYQTLKELCGRLKDYDTGEEYDEIIGQGILEKYKEA